MSRIFRVFINHTPNEIGEEVILPESEAVHLSRVLRLHQGDKVEALDGKGGIFPSQCLEVNRSMVRIRILEHFIKNPQVPGIRLAVAVGKGNKWEELIRPLTELGACRLTPLLTQRTELSMTEAKFSEKKERWQKIARDACKQSGNPWLPKLDDPVSFNDALSQTQGDDCWIGSLREERIKLSPNPSKRSVSIFIGPEGGWTEEEEENALKAEFSFFTLGIHVLRMETAAISALAVARQYLLC